MSITVFLESFDVPRLSFYILPSTIVTLTLAVWGCGGREPAPAPPTALSESAPAKPDESPERLIQATVDNAADHIAKDVASESSEGPRLATQLAAADDEEVSETTARAGRERIMLLTPGGPMLIDLWLSVDERPHTQEIESLVRRVLAAGDADKDGRSTWKELISNKRFLLGPLAGLTSTTMQQARQWTERFDTQQDGRIQPGEAKSWLGRNGMRSAMAFSLRSYLSGSSAPHLQSRVWRLLDADRNGQLSADELDQAPLRLLSRDADDDHLLRLDDLDTVRDQIRRAEINSMPNRRDEGRHAALLLDRDSDWYRVRYLLSNQYATRSDLTHSSFPLFPTLFGELDTDGDGFLTENELAELAARKPHVVVHVSFGTSRAVGETGPSLELTEHVANLVRVSSSSRRRIVLTLADIHIGISVHDMAPADDFETAATERFAALDRDRNGYLDEEEVKTAEPLYRESFLTLDADENGMITAVELADSLRLRQAVVRSQIRLTVHDLDDSVFNHLDTDHDGQLGEREIAGASARLSSLDDNGDRRLSSDEIPRQMTVALVRGGLQNDRSFDVPAITPRKTSDDDLPEWFVRADFNQDGEVSKREFLGSLDQFRQLDVDTDGFIEPQEAASAEGD